MVFNRFLDITLIKFPIYLPLFYFFILYQFPTFEFLLVFATLCLLAEPHFGATWPLYINKINRNKIFSEKFLYIYAPILIILLSIFSYIYLNIIFLIFFFAINILHVTRQSYGISKLYIKNYSEINFQKYIIYFFGTFFFLIGIIRFYLNINSSQFILILNLLVLILMAIILILYIYKYNFSENILLFITGIIIFYPICFVSKPIHGIVMGVTMHYIQYLTLTYKVVKKRKDEDKNIISKINIYFFIIVFSYGIFMGILSNSNQFNFDYFYYLLLFPLLGQLLHFYLDALLWKFSDKHNRDVTLKFLKS